VPRGGGQAFCASQQQFLDLSCHLSGPISSDFISHLTSHLISLHPVSFHLISSDPISSHFTSHLTSHLISFDPISLHVISSDPISFHFISHLTSHLMSSHVMSYFLNLFHIIISSCVLSRCLFSSQTTPALRS
jgi:hypothetical protein